MTKAWYIHYRSEILHMKFEVLYMLNIIIIKNKLPINFFVQLTHNNQNHALLFNLYHTEIGDLNHCNEGLPTGPTPGLRVRQCVIMTQGQANC